MKKYKLKTTIITCYSTGGTLGINPMIIIKEGEVLTEQPNGEYVFENRETYKRHYRFPTFEKNEVENNADLFEIIN